MATTTNYSWVTPDDSDPFKQGASAIRTLGSSVDTTVYGLGQGVKSYLRNNAATTTLASTAETVFLSGVSFTPVAGRLYEVTYTIGRVTKTTAAGVITVRLRKDTLTGTILDQTDINIAVNEYIPLSKTFLLTTTQMGTAAFTPTLCVQTNAVGAIFANNQNAGAIIVKDIGVI